MTVYIYIYIYIYLKYDNKYIIKKNSLHFILWLIILFYKEKYILYIFKNKILHNNKNNINNNIIFFIKIFIFQKTIEQIWKTLLQLV